MRIKLCNGCVATVIVLLGLFGLPLQTVQAASPEKVADITVFMCTPSAVATFNGTGTYAPRVHVQCSEGFNSHGQYVFYYAVSGRDPAAAARALSLFTTAQVTGKQLKIYFDPEDTSGTAFGCASANCRTAVGVQLNP